MLELEDTAIVSELEGDSDEASLILIRAVIMSSSPKAMSRRLSTLRSPIAVISRRKN